MANEYITAKEAAEALGLQYKTFVARVARGDYPTVKKLGWTLLVPKELVRNNENIKQNLESTTR